MVLGRPNDVFGRPKRIVWTAQTCRFNGANVSFQRRKKGLPVWQAFNFCSHTDIRTAGRPRFRRPVVAGREQLLEPVLLPEHSVQAAQEPTGRTARAAPEPVRR